MMIITTTTVKMEGGLHAEAVFLVRQQGAPRGKRPLVQPGRVFTADTADVWWSSAAVGRCQWRRHQHRQEKVSANHPTRTQQRGALTPPIVTVWLQKAERKVGFHRQIMVTVLNNPKNTNHTAFFKRATQTFSHNTSKSLQPNLYCAAF